MVRTRKIKQSKAEVEEVNFTVVEDTSSQGHSVVSQDQNDSSNNGDSSNANLEENNPFPHEKTSVKTFSEDDTYSSYIKSDAVHTDDFETSHEESDNKDNESANNYNPKEVNEAIVSEMEICDENEPRSSSENNQQEANDFDSYPSEVEQKYVSEIEIAAVDSQNAMEDDSEINEVQQKVVVEIEIEEEEEEESVDKRVTKQSHQESSGFEKSDEIVEKYGEKDTNENGNVDNENTNEEDQKDGSKLEDDTEMVSEDELPSEGEKRVPDTEAVSDEELPTISADIPDTEQVSDDELPPVAKRKRKHSSRHSSDSDQKSDSSGKRNKQEKEKSRISPSRSGDGDSSSERRSPDNKGVKTTPKSKLLPELEKYWKAVKDDPTDFTGWTYLLQYVDQESDLEAAREAYDTFLSHYPYCYGYWRKYADYEKRKGEKSKCEEVFERGLKAIPLSVDLWLHYLNFCKSAIKDDEEHLRNQFKRAIDQCGLEFRSDRLWDCYIKWETEGKHLQNVCQIYDQLLRFYRYI